MFLVGIITSLSGPKEKIGLGMLHSLELGFKLAQEENLDKSLAVSVKAIDDSGNPFGALEAFEKCLNDGCDAIIGPADSDSMRAILEKFSNLNIPVISTIATATDLIGTNSSNFYRLTTPDASRAEMLIQTLREIYTGSAIKVFAAKGAQFSYSQCLKRDVESYLISVGIEHEVEEFSTGLIEVNLPEKKQPIIICAVSADAVLLCQFLRKKKCRNQVFSFGSNSNWLDRSALGTIVVADLDRGSTDARIRSSLKRLEEKHSLTDPSLPTVNAGYILYKIFKGVQSDGSTNKTAANIGRLLRGNVLQGIFGPLSFTVKGEMAGYEQITPLKVRRRLAGYRFSALKRREVPTLNDTGWLRRTVIEALGVIGGIASIIGLILFFLK